ncbi:Cnl1p [Saccharomyces paradoxus]|uniref:Biogenesis of lysosome-related organelles complex 1 subunit CNL1 n=1 Tax=Saccharomyces paradoxus TaxID=27291 RepID=A0A8B8UP85_SACPA|nr:Cnl1 [Saccharomyces paradoxus]QHS72547.1 Cnl1 [Saccharomyces paradoxus]
MQDNSSHSRESASAGDDPLGIDKLTVDYDYLLYKIKDYVQSIQLDTTELCKKQNEVMVNGIIENTIDKNIAKFKQLLEKCDTLENHYEMLNQLAMITDTFKERIAEAVNDYNSIKKGASKSK